MKPKLIQITSHESDLYGLAENGAVYKLTTEEKYVGPPRDMTLDKTRQAWELVTNELMFGDWE